MAESHDPDRGSAILFATAAVVGLGALVCVARAIGVRGTAVRMVLIGRALPLLGATTAIAFPAVLYRELVDIAVPLGADIGWMPTGIAQTALLEAFVVYDPFGAFPERDVAGGLVFDVGPRLVTALLLLGPGLLASSVSQSSRVSVARP